MDDEGNAEKVDKRDQALYDRRPRQYEQNRKDTGSHQCNESQHEPGCGRLSDCRTVDRKLVADIFHANRLPSVPMPETTGRQALASMHDYPDGETYFEHGCSRWCQFFRDILGG